MHQITLSNLQFLFTLILVIQLTSCNNTPTSEDNKQKEETEKQQEQQETFKKNDGIKEISKCNCTIEKIDHYVENINENAQTFIDTFSIEGAMGVEGSIKYIGDGKVEGSAKDINQNEIKAIRSYIGKSNFDGNPMIPEIYFVRNAYCGNYVFYCKIGNVEGMEKQVLEFTNYVLNRLKENTEPEKKK